MHLMSSATRKLCYRKDDRAMRTTYVDRMSRCGDVAIRNYPRWRPAAIVGFDVTGNSAI